MGAIHLGHEEGFAESWQRDRGLHENTIEGFRLLAEHVSAKGWLSLLKEATDEQEDDRRRKD